jgi:hypothetical protein
MTMPARYEPVEELSDWHGEMTMPARYEPVEESSDRYCGQPVRAEFS